MTRKPMNGSMLREGMLVALSATAKFTRPLRRVERDGQVYRLRFYEGAAHRLNSDDEVVWVDSFEIGDKVQWNGSMACVRMYHGTITALHDGYADVVDNEWHATSGVAFSKLERWNPNEE